MIVHSCFRTLFSKITLKSEWLPRSQMSFHSDSGVSIALGLTFWPYMMFTLFPRVLHVGPIDAPVRGQPAFDLWDNVRPVLDSVNSEFKQHYMFPHFFSIDESMVGMKNTCSTCRTSAICGSASISLNWVRHWPATYYMWRCMPARIFLSTAIWARHTL